MPTFIASGDPSLARFGRDAAAVALLDPPQYDYARDSASEPPGDPTFAFYSFPTTTRLHDLWHALILKQDLLDASSDFHSRHSRLYLRDDSNWTNIPAQLSITAASAFPQPPESAFEVPLVDGAFSGNSGCAAVALPGSCVAEENLSASQKAVFWMNREVCRSYGIAVQCRNAGINFPSLGFTAASIGEMATGTVMLPDGYESAWIFAFDEPDELPLATGDVLLCRDGGSGELLGQSPTERATDGTVTFEIEIPNNPLLVGAVLHTQAWVYDNDNIHDKALTNAQDLEIQP